MKIQIVLCATSEKDYVELETPKFTSQQTAEEKGKIFADWLLHHASAFFVDGIRDKLRRFDEDNC